MVHCDYAPSCLVEAHISGTIQHGVDKTTSQGPTCTQACPPLLPPASQRVPRELLHHILAPLRPHFALGPCGDSTLRYPSVGASVFSSRQHDFAGRYLGEMRWYVALRLVGRLWDAVLVPLVYEVCVVPTRFPVTRASVAAAAGDAGQLGLVRGQVGNVVGGGSGGGGYYGGGGGVNEAMGVSALLNSRITNPYGRVHKLVQVLKGDSEGGGEGLTRNLVENIRTLVLYDFCHPFSSSDHAADETRAVMALILGQFARSDIRRVHVYGRETYAFGGPRDSEWLGVVLPELKNTVRDVCFDAVDKGVIERALVGLGERVEAVEIRNRSRLWDVDYGRRAGSALVVPKQMPRLERLRLMHISTTLEEFRRLLSSVGGKASADPKGAQNEEKIELISTLKSLTVTQLFVLNEDPQVGGFYSPLTAAEFSGLLDINSIASNLTDLYIGPGLYSMSDAYNVIWRPEVVTEIVQKCRRLITFGYTSIIDAGLVNHLPGDLREVALALRPSLCPPAHVFSHLDSLGMFGEFIGRARERGVGLRKVTVLVMEQLKRNPGFWRMSFEDVEELLEKGRSELEELCLEAGIELCYDLI